jgi:hypothetical protein
MSFSRSSSHRHNRSRKSSQRHNRSRKSSHRHNRSRKSSRKQTRLPKIFLDHKITSKPVPDNLEKKWLVKKLCNSTRFNICPEECNKRTWSGLCDYADTELDMYIKAEEEQYKKCNNTLTHMQCTDPCVWSNKQCQYNSDVIKPKSYGLLSLYLTHKLAEIIPIGIISYINKQIILKYLNIGIG